MPFIVRGTYVERRSVNDFFGSIFTIVEPSSFLTVRQELFTHHRHLGSFERDMTELRTMPPFITGVGPITTQR